MFNIYLDKVQTQQKYAHTTHNIVLRAHNLLKLLVYANVVKVDY